MGAWQPQQPSGPQQPPQPEQPAYSPQPGYPQPQQYPPQQSGAQPAQPQYPQQGYPQQTGYPQAPGGPTSGQYAPPTGPTIPAGTSGPQYPGQPAYPPTPPGYPTQQYPGQPGAPQYAPQPSAPYGASPYGTPYGTGPQQPQQGRNNRLLLIIGVSVAVILALCVGLIFAARTFAGNGTGSNNHPSATATTAPTATPATLSSATLGGTLNGFTAKYGQPIDSSSTTADYEVTLAGIPAAILMTLQIGKDGTLHVATIVLGPQATNSNGWDQTTMLGIVASLIPSDSQLDQNQSNNDFGVTRVFVSQSLAQTFSTSLFTSESTKQAVTPGSLWVLCLPSSNSSTSNPKFDICTFSLGTP